MSQVYHSNVRTNQHVRCMIQESDLTNVELAKKYNLNVKTISKWRNRDFSEDKSSKPQKIDYALTPLDVTYLPKFPGTVNNSLII